MTSTEPEPGAAPKVDTTSPPKEASPAKSSKSSTKSKEEKKKYPKIRKQLIEHYGLSIRDHFIRDCFKKIIDLNENEPDLDILFQEAINQTLTNIAEPFLPFTIDTKKSKNKSGNKSPNQNLNKTDRLKGKLLLQVFSIRDVSKSQQQQNYLDTGKDSKRMLHFVLSDGKNKVNAVEYQHIVLLELNHIHKI